MRRFVIPSKLYGVYCLGGILWVPVPYYDILQVELYYIIVYESIKNTAPTLFMEEQFRADVFLGALHRANGPFKE